MTVEKKSVPKELLEGLLADYRKPEDLIGENGALKQRAELAVEKTLGVEMTNALTTESESVERQAGNTCNGKSKKTCEGRIWRTAH